jgi:hypothetical protein
MNKFLLIVAYIIRSLKLPHLCKYGLFVIIKSRNIPTQSVILLSQKKIKLNLGEFIEYWIFMDGTYEKNWVLIAHDFVKGKVLIDIGANIGTYPLSLCKSAKKIYAFEPEKANYMRLVDNIEINKIKNIVPFQLAVYSQNNKS